MRCIDCGGHTSTTYSKYQAALCDACYEKRGHIELEAQAKTLTDASDFSTWSKRDMSELFWSHLGRYINEPNEESLVMMEMANRWACHDDQGLANSFHNAMKWAKLNLYVERKKWLRRNEVKRLMGE